MAIDFECACGKKLKSKDEYAGKKTKCPVCGAALLVPQTAAKQAAAAAAAAASAAETSSAGIAVEPLAIDMSESSVKIEPISSASIETAAHVPLSRDADPPTNGNATKYKVLTSKDMGFFAKFDAAKLEETLNSWSATGWHVKSVLTMTYASHSGQVNDLLVILEK